jgi:hypothetical protein
MQTHQERFLLLAFYLVGGGRADYETAEMVLVRAKKEEFPSFMKTCCLRTPFPRSALFLNASLRIIGGGTRVLKGYE